MTHPVTVSTLHTYPIKSCKSLSHNVVSLDRKGVVGDRRLLVVNTDGRFLTQRELPAMVHITPTLTDGGIRLEAPAMPPLELALTDTADADHAAMDVVVWQDTIKAVSQGRAAAEWLSTFLKTPCQLVAMERDFRRIVDQLYAPRPDDETSFGDGFPLLLISEASLDDLNSRLQTRGEQPIPMNRFRPNIVVSGCEAFAEDRWKRVRIGGVVFDVVKPCGRCIITTTDQETGVRGKEPIATLKTYRKNSDGTKILFGQNLVHQLAHEFAANGSQRLPVLRVGDVIEVVA